MSFTELTCHKCGGELYEANGKYKCTCCGKLFEKRNTESIADEMKAVLGEQKQEAVANLRQRLWKEIHKKYINNAEVEKICSEILNYLPEDFYAGFYAATCSKQKSALSDFFENVNLDDHIEDIPELCDYLLTALRPEWTVCVGNLIESFKRSDDMNNYNAYRERFEQEYEAMDEGVFEPSLHRDVFVCYSSSDMAAVDKLVSELESEGITCFVAARNLRHGAGSVDKYQEAIHTAIKSCSVVVFLSSIKSRNFRCEAISELNYIEENCPNMARVEYLLQDYRGVSTERNVKDFFKGLEYCTSIDGVINRVINAINQPQVDKQAELKKQLEEQIRREYEEKLAKERAEAEYAKRRAEEEARLKAEEEARRKAEQVERGSDEKGDYVLFGSYPQTKVTDIGLTSQLNNLAGTLPTSSNSGKWTSYDYYIENSNATDFMWYCDVSYNGEKYRGVYFDKYRPSWTSVVSSYNNQKGNGYINGKVYWFKYEPIKWRVLGVKGKEAFVACDKLIDSRDYNHTQNNNYADSGIRKWLNNEFYNAAFSEAEKAKILQRVVDNGLASTCDRRNEYVCKNTNDKIFLLSKKEAMTAQYFKDSQARQKTLTDYAQCQGAYSFGWWWLRSPDCSRSDHAGIVHSSGDLYCYCVLSADGGICSALKMVIE